MRLVLSAFLILSRPHACHAFAPAPFVAGARATHHKLHAWQWPFGRKDVKERTALLPDVTEEESTGGFTSGLVGDLGSVEEVEEETEALMKRIGHMGSKFIQNAWESFEDDDHIDLEPVKKDGICACLPTKEMTGVEPAMSQLCSTISAQIYSRESHDQFKLSTKDMKTDLFLYNDHGAFRDTTPPFLAATTGKTMILGWRGTNTLADVLNDVAASPLASLAWSKHANTIKAHGAMTSIAHSDIVTHQNAIIAKAKELGITEIITTGQSLGGGLAQIGHLTLRALIENEQSQWNELEGVNVRSVVFCAPMTTVLLDNATPKTDAFIEKLWNNSCNFVYKNDIVPRGYGYLSFIEDFLENTQEDVAGKVPMFTRRLFDVQGRLIRKLQGAKDKDALRGLLGVYSQYRHMGNVIYYESEDAKPLVLKDMGAFYKNSKGEKDTFRSVKYKPVKHAIKEAKDWHMDIIMGPGLSFPEDQLM